MAIVIVGNGMVGHRLCERLTELRSGEAPRMVVFCEEPRPAYDRVHLTSYLTTRTADALCLANREWYASRGIALHVNERAVAIDRDAKCVVSSTGRRVAYDTLVLATGSAPFVPRLPGVELRGVFVYRTLEDLDAIAAYAHGARRAAVLGGGLLGLEAAKALHDLGLETHVVELAARLMPRQLDPAGASLLARSVEALGVRAHLGQGTTRVLGDAAVTGLELEDATRLDVDMVVISAGIVPRDDLARSAGIAVGARGGVVVDDRLTTSDPNVVAIGEVALHRSIVYGLVAPGYEMAEVVASNLTGGDRTFTGTDLSAKLKLLGVDVASFGDPFADARTQRSIVFGDWVKGVYKKLALSEDGTRLLGGILVGDAGDYVDLVHRMRTAEPLPESPESLILGAASVGGGKAKASSRHVCSCNNVSREQVVCAIREKALASVGDVKACTRAGTGCGGCLPTVADILADELAAAGKATRAGICEHFAYSRKELFEIVKVHRTRTFEALIQSHGTGSGCEICKPAVASILASLWNEPILQHSMLQDTNDRFLANLQRGGLYSVVPRVPGGELTPEKLIVLGQVAKKYGLYTKVTGGQRIDLFGARVNDLPDIWEELVRGGFESGHAYGKAMRTVKSCVGSTWCRYGVQDSVGFAIRIENRYKGVRAPHKMKSAVSGCVRECAEAQSKDFGVIATEKGWNVYVCGNGGAKPRHADLLASDLDEATVIRYLDRFVMYYITTADRLTRTSVWLDKMEGGIEYLRKVIIDDRLGICAELERQMQRLVDTYECEWTRVVNDPAERARFKHFVNSDSADDTIELVSERGQTRPKDWMKAPAEEKPKRHLSVVTDLGERRWVRVARASDIPAEGGACVRYGAAQIAVFNFASRGEWFASQNLCPHMKDMVLSRGIVGDQCGTPKVACPVHKKTFSLESGECLSGEGYRIVTFPVRVDAGHVYLELPNEEAVEAMIGRGDDEPHSESAPSGLQRTA